MFSLIVYGRNDSYGYNLHKRAALSLNCMAEALDDPDDEILFVDYNTPDDYPTFPEAIQDTLTGKAKQVLRVLRVRSDVHDRLFRARSRLNCLEPISRNVAIRRSNPNNRWVLSTNTDMIFVPRRGGTLNSALQDLPDGFYGAPRFEIPESIWESFDRYDGRGVINEAARWAEIAHLNEIVYGVDDILYDGPGDFQLMLREDLFRIHGFHEQMLVGWHVDANISRRLGMIHGAVGDAGPYVSGYHCDHTRQVTPAHRHDSEENDADLFVASVSSPELPDQKDSWGCPEEDIEEIRLHATANHAYMQALSEVIREPLKQPYKQYYRPETFSTERVHVEHVLPFLSDIFVNAPRSQILAWAGQQGPVFDMFSQVLARLGFRTPLQVMDGTAASDAPAPAAFIFNFGVPDTIQGEAAAHLRNQFLDVVETETARQAQGLAPRRIVGVNAIHNEFEALVINFVGCARGPFSTKLRHGFVVEGAAIAPFDWLSGMRTTGISKRAGKTIGAPAGSSGHMAFGPYRPLFRGWYEARIGLETGAAEAPGAALDGPAAAVEIVIQDETVAQMDLESPPNTRLDHFLPFGVSYGQAGLPVQVRLTSFGRTSLTLDTVVIDRFETSD